MTAGFKDHFSDRAAGYATYRPQYPPALGDYLAGLAPSRRAAWDVGCGSGQFTIQLGERFERVIATDASAEQIARATPHARVRYAVAPADRAPIDSTSIDLIVAAQAAHWFDLPAFYKEVRRVAVPNGIVALVTYGIADPDPDISPVIDDLYHNVLKHHWPPERRSTENAYADFDFPFDELTPPRIEMAVVWTVEQTLGYIGTWSAVRAMDKAEGGARFIRFCEDLRLAWGATMTRRIAWPLGIRAGVIRA